ncbi:iron uptake transporter deferrochelatase/peroxidase subunit [Brevibacterium sp. R8603A2]|uniref:iron uptake transporter deferrochelatase/peroxidase subunit n=1 Tax=Brevibacterium sp. R8603A2 TaxID=2929779 RepID=UPI001FFA9B8E|nr:iron uptake transporter deferrochelatase/peroxidase subunit [Brevibacterium sp. R8603A2]MCK1803516.1 iron uptake transporter deferrochelatase/peroxidase subunit [Brevibacterium sp. R8603A2]
MAESNSRNSADASAAGTGTSRDSAAEQRSGVRRRGMLGLLGGGVAGLVAGGVGGSVAGAEREKRRTAAAPRASDLTYDFEGGHQAGIITEVQDQMHFAAFDLADDTDRDDLIELLQDWTTAAWRLVLGGEVSARGAFGGGTLFPPDDTGEAFGTGPEGLTLTFGFGRSLFEDASGRDRFGLRRHLPEHFSTLPVMANDFIVPETSEGDLCIQACANDPQVAVHAIRNLTRIAVGKASIRWSQLGFGRSSTTTAEQETPRNLFGQKDGTNNIKADETAALAEHVWIDASNGPAWAVGGTYLIARRITMTIEVWDSLQLGEQERVTGRDKHEGSPLSGGTEFTPPDFSKTDDRGNPVIDERSHVFRAHPDNNGGVRMLRRGFNFVDGNDAQGRLEAGQFFIAFVNDPARFSRVHRNLARDDLFVEYLKTTGTGVYLVPPGVRGADDHIGRSLLTAG